MYTLKHNIIRMHNVTKGTVESYFYEIKDKNKRHNCA
jgi:hypothetical protein